MKTPMPANITPEELAQWNREFDQRDAEYLAKNPRLSVAREMFRILFPLWIQPNVREAHLCGVWLGRELAALGCDDTTLEKICWANGQKCAAQVWDDPWAITLDSLDAYKRGQWDEPGDELGEKLFVAQMVELQRQFGPPTPEAQERARRLFEAEGPPPVPKMPSHF